MHEPTKYLHALGLSDSETTIYLAMLKGVTRARDLVKATGIKRPTVYYVLSTLEKRGLISKTGLEGEKRFSVEPLTTLERIADEQVRVATELKANIKAILPVLSSTQSEASEKPVISFYEGKDAVKRVIMDMLYAKSKIICSVAPADNFFWQVGKDFVRLFVEDRVRRNIKTKNLWEKTVDKKILQLYYQGGSQVRIVPEIMQGKFKTTMFLYDDKVLCVSSLKNSYCVLLTSKEYKDTMQAWFDGIWSFSKSV